MSLGREFVFKIIDPSYSLAYLFSFMILYFNYFAFFYSSLSCLFNLSLSLKVFMKYLNPAILTLGDFKILIHTAPSIHNLPYDDATLSHNAYIFLASSSLF